MFSVKIRIRRENKASRFKSLCKKRKKPAFVKDKDQECLSLIIKQKARESLKEREERAHLNIL